MPRVHGTAPEAHGFLPGGLLISRVRGRLVGLDVDRIEVDTGAGVVYEVHVPLTVFNRLPAQGAELELLTAYIVRDDTPSLYGFLDIRERTLFLRLLTVQMVGPRLALAMMSAYHAGRLARAIAERDAKVLIQVSGLGRKTAERVILELSDKVRDIAVTEVGDDPDSGRAAEAVAALISLGYSFAEADTAVRDASGGGGAETTEELVRRVLADRAAAPGP